MLTNIKNRLLTAMMDRPPLPGFVDSNMFEVAEKKNKFTYGRPAFLQLLTKDELNASSDHNLRPIIVPRDIANLPWGTGYAECVNAGKSDWNEDQAAFCQQVLSDPTKKHPDLPYTYFGIFDGHAGYGAALAASKQFHHILHEKLVDIIDLLLQRGEMRPQGLPNLKHFYRPVTKDELVIGALESAFYEMDTLIDRDRQYYKDAGGCTALVALFIYGTMFVANAGDSRGVLCQQATAKVLNGDDGGANTSKAFPVPFSFDHTPETERRRLMTVCSNSSISQIYSPREYAWRPRGRDLGQRILCREANNVGWVYKTLGPSDLKIPVVTGEGKRSRLLGTLGVTRGFGDYNLLAINTNIGIKRFLTPHPEVKSRDLSKIVSIPGENNEDGDYGILVMATDGLWDVSDNDSVANTVFQTLAKYPMEKHRYTMVAQELVAKARGKINDSGHWRLADSKAAATVDDISVIVIPVYQYYKEHAEWERKCAEEATSEEVVTNGTAQEEEVSAAASALEATEIHSNNDERENRGEEDTNSPEVTEAAEP